MVRESKLVIVITLFTLVLLGSSESSISAASDFWLPMTTSGAPEGRSHQMTIWTGSEMIVWGGQPRLNGPTVNTGGRYDPISDSWTSITTVNAPSARRRAAAVWTGTEMIVWGGDAGDAPAPLYDSGGKYNPATDTWTAISTQGAPSARWAPASVWTGVEMIVWGGSTINHPPTPTDTGARYDPASDTWTAMSTAGAPSPRQNAYAFWTGTEVIIWGGSNQDGTEAKYNPATDTWTTMSTVNAPPYGGTAVWTGNEMIAWSAQVIDSELVTYGARYEPVSDVWTPISTDEGPSGRAPAIWTGTEMVMWGGIQNPIGKRYNPSTDTWSPMTFVDAPEARAGHSIIWTGTEVVVWGGQLADPDDRPNTGGRYYLGPSNQPPTVSAGGPYSVIEGGAVNLVATGDDPDGDTLIYAWDLDNDGSYETSGQSVNYLSIDGPSSHVASVRVNDSGGLSATDSANITVYNDAPSVSPITAPIDPVLVDSQITSTATFTDPGILDTHTAEWGWGDGTKSAGTVTETDGSGSVSDTHTYNSPGVYTIKLTVTDKDGGIGESIFQYIVIYDPEGGFVTGGGWIASPEGACLYFCGNATGKANFGLVSKYKKGATVPAGNTEFNFKAGNLNFHSDTYEWLVITGGNYAKYKGSGTINGALAPNGTLYKFQIWAGDETGTDGEDTFRIKIWYEDNSSEIVVYDNGMDQPIVGGNIQVHEQ